MKKKECQIMTEINAHKIYLFNLQCSIFDLRSCIWCFERYWRMFYLYVMLNMFALSIDFVLFLILGDFLECLLRNCCWRSRVMFNLFTKITLLKHKNCFIWCRLSCKVKYSWYFRVAWGIISYVRRQGML